MLLMLVAPALAIALCAFGVGVLVGAVRVLRRGETTPGQAGALAVVAAPGGPPGVPVPFCS